MTMAGEERQRKYTAVPKKTVANIKEANGKPTAAVKKRQHRKPLHEILDIPANALYSIPYMEIRGNREITLGGYAGLIRYDTEEIVLRLNDQSLLTVSGRNMQLGVIAGNVLKITGDFESILFGKKG